MPLRPRNRCRRGGWSRRPGPVSETGCPAVFFGLLSAGFADAAHPPMRCCAQVATPGEVSTLETDNVSDSVPTAASSRWCPGHSTVATDGSKEVLNGVAALLSTVSDGLSFVDPIDGVIAIRRRPQHSCSLRCLRTNCDRLRAAASGVVPVRFAPLSSLRFRTGTCVPLRSKHRYQSTPDFPGKRDTPGT